MSEQKTRRTFLQQGSAITAGAALAGSIASRAYTAENNEIKLALIGAGGRGTDACNQALSTSGPIKLVAVADAFQDRIDMSLDALKRSKGSQVEVPKDKQFVGFDAYKQAIDSGVDGVILTTPPGFRPEQFEYAVQQGKNVFMEKPVATDGIGVRRVLAANEVAKKKGLKVGVGLQRHHDYRYQEMIKRIREGIIGDIVSMRCYWSGGPLWVKPRLPEQSEMEYQMRNWYYFKWICGDHIVEQHIHNIDVCNWVMGGPPAFAQAHSGRQVRTGKEFGEIYDHHAVEFVYGDKWDQGTHMFSYCRQIEGCWSSVSEHAHGSKGYANLSGAAFYDLKGAMVWRYDERKDPSLKKPGNPYQTEHDVMWDSVRNNGEHNEADAGAESTMTAILGRQASYSGKLLKYADCLNSTNSIMPASYDWKAATPTNPDADGNYPVAVPGKFDVI